MPHDCKGQEIKPGDVVLFRGRVTQVYPGATDCDATIEARDALPNIATPSMTLSSKHLERVDGDAPAE